MLLYETGQKKSNAIFLLFDKKKHFLYYIFMKNYIKIFFIVFSLITGSLQADSLPTETTIPTKEPIEAQPTQPDAIDELKPPQEVDSSSINATNQPLQSPAKPVASKNQKNKEISSTTTEYILGCMYVGIVCIFSRLTLSNFQIEGNINYFKAKYSFDTVSKLSNKQKTALAIAAIRKNDTEFVKKLLDNGHVYPDDENWFFSGLNCKLNKQRKTKPCDQFGCFTLAEYAAYCGNEEMITLFTQKISDNTYFLLVQNKSDQFYWRKYELCHPVKEILAKQLIKERGLVSLYSKTQSAPDDQIIGHAFVEQFKKGPLRLRLLIAIPDPYPDSMAYSYLYEAFAERYAFVQKLMRDKDTKESNAQKELVKTLMLCRGRNNRLVSLAEGPLVTIHNYLFQPTLLTPVEHWLDQVPKVEEPSTE